MKYFTANLLSLFGSEEPVVASAAQEEWEKSCDRYNAYLESIKEHLLPGLRQIEESYSLHDAKVRGMGKQGPFFVMILQLEPPPHSLLTFAFDLAEEPSIDKAALPPPLRSKGEVVEWQYDELELISGQSPAWSWSILLSNGWEVQLHFRDIQVHEVQALIPVPRNGSADSLPTTLSQI